MTTQFNIQAGVMIAIKPSGCDATVAAEIMVRMSQ
jgi:hypothetical protein